MSLMSKLTAAYLAGLIDGEGSLEIQKKDRKYQARIRICLTDEKLIKWLQSSFGGFLEERKFENPNWNNAYVWTLKNTKNVKPFIEKVYPYLRIKKKHAETLKKFLKTFKSNSYKIIANKLGYGTGYHKELRDEIIEERDRYYYQMKELNKRGKSVQPERLNKATP